MKPIKVFGHCCKGFAWEIFDVTADTVYARCGNPDCQNRNVYLDEFGEIDALEKKLAQGPPVDVEAAQ